MSLNDVTEIQSTNEDTNGHSANDSIEALPELAKHAPDLAKAVAELERQLKLARGTGDQSKQAGAAVKIAQVAPEPETAPQTLPDKVKEALLRECLNLQQVVKRVREPAGRVADVLRQMRQDNLVYNVGIAEHPVWSYRIGDETETSELNALVKKLIMYQPFTTRELVDATGARLTRVGGALVAIQRNGEVEIKDYSYEHERAGRWFIESPDARDAKLKPNYVKKSQRAKREGGRNKDE